MKQCPVCQKNYADAGQQFCLDDGAALIVSSTEQATEAFTLEANPIRVNIARDETPTIVAQTATVPQPEPKKGRGWNLIYGLIIGFVVSAILAAVMFAGIFWWQTRGTSEVASNTKPNPTQAATNTSNQTPTPDETANLKQKIANLEKKVQEQKTPKPTVPTITNSTTTQTNKVTAKANSPGDGFLALRNEPSAETGERILKIPHGATLTVLECLPKAPGKNGRWCRVDYNGNLGWAFDGFMIYQ